MTAPNETGSAVLRLDVAVVPVAMAVSVLVGPSVLVVGELVIGVLTVMGGSR